VREMVAGAQQIIEQRLRGTLARDLP
jgi:hypothetical protein